MREFTVGRSKVSRHFHICGFFDSRDEQYDVLMPFYTEALGQDEKVVNIVDPRKRADHFRRLSEAGVEVDRCESCGQLEVMDWDKAYLVDGCFDQERMLVTVDQVFSAGRDAGYPRMRLTGEMGWALTDCPGSEQLIEYEARVNNVLMKTQQPAVCIYDTAQLSGSMMMDILRAHPLTLVGGEVRENPFYMAPEELLRELSERRAREREP
jgi:hypothetical protein